MKLLFIASDAMEFRGLLAHATAVREAQITARWARLATLGANEILMVANGAGPDRAAAATDAGLKAFDAAAIVSTGFCGGLSPDLRIADLVSATIIETSNQTYPCGAANPGCSRLSGGLSEARANLDVSDQTMCDRPPGPSNVGQVGNLRPIVNRPTVASVRDSASGSPTRGPIRSIPYVAQTAEQKRNLAVNGAIAVEMEAAGVAARAQTHGLPFYCIRAVTDLAGETLANDFNKALRLDGQFDTILILKGSLLHPIVRLPELFRLRKRCVRAAHVLGDFFAYSRI